MTESLAVKNDIPFFKVFFYVSFLDYDVKFYNILFLVFYVKFYIVLFNLSYLTSKL